MALEQHQPRSSTDQPRLDDLALPEKRISALAIYQSALWTVALCSDSLRTWTSDGACIDTPFFEYTPRLEGFRPDTVQRVSCTGRESLLLATVLTGTIAIVPEQGSVRIEVSDIHRNLSEERVFAATSGAFVLIRAGLQIRVTGLEEENVIRTYR